jgi:plasmid stabilization system protein ParE
MAGRTVVWTKTAKIQRRAILKYWKERNQSPAYPIKIIKNTDAKIAVLLKHPESGLSTDYADTRISAMGHFSIFYKLDKNLLIITSFWDNRQDPAKLLEIISK